MSSRRLSTGRIAGLLFLCCLAIAGLPLQAQEISRPGIDQGPTVMEARIVLLDVEEISSARQLFTANIFYMFTWLDERLVHEGPGARWLGMDQAWTPSIQLVNQQHDTFPSGGGPATRGGACLDRNPTASRAMTAGPLSWAISAA